ncbi:DUF1493 family protein [Microbulbifer sp. 2205BS26-8]|uniref:DUF1493 family protein n=1 Tax=Microbulbifer sp. 2205BS26-8 TaxID=3064386 RepID=UPI00273FE292|nr:DUF1493 family protein [Microbulbifer sp. 2205BS26-8]MDP5211195.1 DUF1493 family protein [Microbulbifer sp. 2205BS26-8]
MDIQEEVINFVADYTGTKHSKITPSTLINEELNVDGDDGSELLLEFSKKFKVDLTPINETYFGPEGFSLSALIWPVLLLLNALGWRQKTFKDTAPLPVSILIESAKAKKWIASKSNNTGQC